MLLSTEDCMRYSDRREKLCSKLTFTSHIVGHIEMHSVKFG